MAASLAIFSAQEPPKYPEFEHIRRFWMPKYQRYGVKVVAGDYYVTNQDEIISTVLGSCVSACIRDPFAGIGGINHFILPDTDSDVLSASNRYGVFAMEQLINAIIKRGGSRDNFEIKLVGGGNMLETASEQGIIEIGQRNIEFVTEFLTTEGLDVSAKDFGGNQPRKVIYNVKDGRLLVHKMNRNYQARYMQLEIENQSRNQTFASDNDVELFSE